MVSVDADWASGATGMACDTDIAATLRQIANAEATSIFMDFSFSLHLPRRGGVATCARSFGKSSASPVTAMPAAPVPAVPAAMPTPVTTVPVPVPVMPPAHLLGPEMIHFVLGGDSGTHIGRQPAAFFEQIRRKWCCLRANSQRGGAGGKSNGKSQKVAAFHVISSWCMANDAGEILIASR
jgi:hypothetical protein